LRFSLVEALDLPSARCRFGKYLKISLSLAHGVHNMWLKQLTDACTLTPTEAASGLPVRLQLHLKEAEVEFQLGEKAYIHPTDEVLHALMEHVPPQDSMIVYE